MTDGQKSRRATNLTQGSLRSDVQAFATGIDPQNVPPVRGRHSNRRRAFIIMVIGLLAIGLLMMSLLLQPGIAHAQDDSTRPDRYTIVAGDTLGLIATRFDLTVEQLAAANDIADPSYIQVGQVLIIPRNDGSLPLSAIPTAAVTALPGETIQTLAQRFGQEPDQVAALNQTTTHERLFPGRPVLVAQAQLPATSLYFGAVEQVDLPASIVQGRTDQVVITLSRAVSVTATWNGLKLPLTPVTALSDQAAPDQVQQVFAYLPAPPLIAPDSYPVTVNYVTHAGIPVSRTWWVEVVDGNYESQVIIVNDEKNDLLAPDVSTAEMEFVTAFWSEISPDFYWNGAFIRPIGVEYPTTSPFGTRRAYGGGAINGYHAGQDFGAPTGVEIVAPAAGKVVLAQPLNVRGNAVLIDHGRGIFSGYWHMSELSVEPGQAVAAGDLIGLVGTTGLSTGAHLHWELRIYGVAVDPMQFLDGPLLLP